MVLMSSTQNTICNLLYMWRHLIGPLYYQIGSFLLVSRYILYRYIKTVLLLANVVKLFCGSFGPFALYPLLPHCLLTLRCQINESGGKSASRVWLVNTFFCLFICFFLYVSLIALFPPYSFIWHLRVIALFSNLWMLKHP